MRRMWKLSGFERCRSIAYCHRPTNENGTQLPIQVPLSRRYAAEMPQSDGTTLFSNVVPLFIGPQEAQQHFRNKVSALKDEILGHGEDVVKIKQVLDEKGASLFQKYPNGSAAIELLSQLKRFPSVAMEVFTWRRNEENFSSPITAEEYAKGISVAGRLMCIDLAVELFTEAMHKQLKTTSVYNALMSAYMNNGLPFKCQALFESMKVDSKCAPSIITYNILISAFGRVLMVNHMEATLMEILRLNLSPTIKTYRGLISGYLTAWKWDKMEKTYRIMESGPVKPDIGIRLLMLQGYANCLKLRKMEEIYDVVRDQVKFENFHLIRAMIRAYCRSSDAAKVEKVGKLLRLIPDNEHRPWLNVLLIRFYAREDLLEQMEDWIDEAFHRRVYITTSGIMRCIISSYFRHHAVDKLSDFVHRAERAGWKLCRSLYHCQLVMYALHMRPDEMEGVLDKMDRIDMPLSKKTLWILYCAYQKLGHRSKLELVAGLMCKRGYPFSLPQFSSS